MNYKTLYGYRIVSEFDLPYLPDDTGEKNYGTVYLSFGQTPDTLDNALVKRPGFELNKHQLLVKDTPVGTFFLKRENEDIHISIQTIESFFYNTLMSYIAGSVFVGAMHLKDELVLHASSVHLNNQMIMIAGDPGAGKSSTVAALLKQNKNMLTDDVCVIRKGEGKFYISPGTPYLRLWKDAAEQLGYEYHEQNRILEDDDKYWIPIPSSYSCESKMVTHLFYLSKERREQVSFEEVKGFEKVKMLKRIKAIRMLVNMMQRQPSFFRQAAPLADQLKIYQVYRPEGYYSEQIADQIKEIVNVKKNSVQYAK